MFPPAQVTFLLLPVLAQAAQISFKSPVQPSEAWDLDRPHHAVNSTSNFVFATASSFLQHWPNTRYRNGHNFVPGTIPIGTLLYHGRRDNKLPTTPEWTAVDPEHSTIFCGLRGGNPSSNGSCWHLTLSASRPLKVLYFDGSSAAKMPDGPMDSQDLLAWGKVVPEFYFKEMERLDRLCEWGGKFGLDGFVRMEMDFEVMLCDFTAGVEVVSFDRLVPPVRPLRLPLPPQQPGDRDTMLLNSMDLLSISSLNNHYPGDRRIRLDYTRMVSLYDTTLAPSLVDARFGKHRLEHRLQGISPPDINTVISHLELALKQETSQSGVDWETFLRVVINKFAGRIENVQYFLNFTAEDSDKHLLSRAKQAHKQVRGMLQPYLLQSAVEKRDAGDKSPTWASPIYESCAVAHTKAITHAQGLTESETFLLSAIQETTKEICRILTRIWAEGINVGLDDTLAREHAPASGLDPSALLQGWKSQINGLMEWLDWSVWLKCRPACSFEEMCYLPTWPYFMVRPGGPGRDIPKHPRRDSRTKWDISMLTDEERAEYKDPQPRCVPRLPDLD